MRAIDPNQVHDYVLEEERKAPAESRTVFKIKAPTARCERDAALAGKETVVHEVHVGLRECLTGWENYPHPNGQPAPFTKDGDGRMSDTSLGFIYWPHQVELYGAIRKLGGGQMTETEKGN